MILVSCHTPNPNFNGDDSFTYTVCDTFDACATATVHIVVSAVNDPPVAHFDVAIIYAGETVTIRVADNDVNVDGETLSVVRVSPPHDGTDRIIPDNTITYTHQTQALMV
jgi:large repetitive protein